MISENKKIPKCVILFILFITFFLFLFHWSTGESVFFEIKIMTFLWVQKGWKSKQKSCAHMPYFRRPGHKCYCACPWPITEQKISPDHLHSAPSLTKSLLHHLCHTFVAFEYEINLRGTGHSAVPKIHDNVTHCLNDLWDSSWSAESMTLLNV